MTDDELKAIEARVNAATPGPWEYFSSVDQRRFGIGLGLSADISFGPDDVHLRERPRLKYALEFIAHARADIPALIAALRAAREAVIQIRDCQTSCIEGEADEMVRIARKALGEK